MQPDLFEIEAWARQAGDILRQSYGKQHQIDRKGQVDLVTEVDRRSEEFLLGQIRARFADHTIIAEESGLLNGNGHQTWYIDPLDGTTNYAHGLPLFAVSLAYAEDKQVRLGVVYDPSSDTCFCAERGRGAWRNGQPIHVSGNATLLDSLLVTGFPYDLFKTSTNNLDHFGRLSRRCQGVRRLGSAALDLCYVACGWLDGYWELKINPWDIAAGGLIAEEAGALVTRMQGDPYYLTPPCDILAANPALHSILLAALQEKDV